jgi:3-dehydroquinate dehydratase/shikimate dehydrogenase
MTHLTVPIFVQSREQALAAAARAAELGADLIEYRLDRLVDAGQGRDITDLVQASALPCIITVRPTWEGGHCDADDATRAAVFQAACAGVRKPAYLDLELVSYQRSPQLRECVEKLVDHPGQITATSTGLILSSHDFQGRPADLLQRLEAMTQAPACRVIKLAWLARSLRDNLEAFEIIQQQYKPTIALCMGEFGLPSRVLAKKFGALLTFAALDEDSNTAPGQPTLADLKRLYRWDHLTAATEVFGVVGWPVGHSLSPHVHNAGFAATHRDAVYLPMPVAPAFESFKATVGTWLDFAPLHFRGCSVTIPHKENLLRFVTERGGDIEPLAAHIGAANTLSVRANGKLHASNSDYAAALDSVCAGMGVPQNELNGLRIAVIGAGGAARAIVAGFAQHGAAVVIYNRTLDRAAALARDFAALPGKVVAAPLDKLCDSCCNVFINCTPIGMSPHTDATPLPTDVATRMSKGVGWGPGVVVFDTIYNPIQTRLLREARAAGCVAISGVEMFVRQAATQFELWTGVPAPLDVFRAVMLDRLMG